MDGGVGLRIWRCRSENGDVAVVREDDALALDAVSLFLSISLLIYTRRRFRDRKLER